MGKTLSDMVLDFFEFEVGNEIEWRSDEEDEVLLAETKTFWTSQHQLIQEAFSRRSSAEKKIQRVMEDIIRKLQSSNSICTCLKECRQNCLPQNVVNELRNLGYNSAICKSKWRKSLDIPSGEHDFIDVIIESKDTKKGPIRVLIELNFRSEFEMARASSDYNSLVTHLPQIFIGKAEKLRNVIKIMCNAGKKWMKDYKMHMAPWRKHKYMQSKWFGGTCERLLTQSVAFLESAVVDRSLRPRASMLTVDLQRPASEVAWVNLK